MTNRVVKLLENEEKLALGFSKDSINIDRPIIEKIIIIVNIKTTRFRTSGVLRTALKTMLNLGTSISSNPKFFINKYVTYSGRKKEILVMRISRKMAKELKKFKDSDLFC